MTLNTSIPQIPTYLIYEMDDGKPIYYKGYQEVLNGTKTKEQIMSDSSLQAWLKGKIYLIISNFLDGRYDVTVGEQGLHFSKKNWRAIDIAIFKFENLVLNNKYSKLPPEIAIEIDSKAADTDTPSKFLKYFNNKNKKLFKFGVKKIIWIFTDSKTVKVITPRQTLSYGWEEDFTVIDDLKLNLVNVFKNYRREVFLK